MYLLLLDVIPMLLLVGGTYLVEIDVTMPKCAVQPVAVVAETSSFLAMRRVDDKNEEDFVLKTALAFVLLAVAEPLAVLMFAFVAGVDAGPTAAD